MKILVVGDIHGRTFWKSPVERYINKVDKIVFLGDYFDPYPNDDGECPSFTFMMNNFNEILDLKKANPDKVVLLYGNHDYHYASKKFDDMARSTRFNNFKSYELRQTFNENSDLFQLCYIANNENKKVVFTHAGITKFWLDLCGIKNDENSEAEINNLKNDDEGASKLAIIGIERTWLGEKTGSPLWCDLTEFVRNEGLGKGFMQIFGHTRLKKGACASATDFACLDCEYCFILNDKCKLRRIEDEKVKDDKKQPAEQDSANDSEG